MPTLSRWWCRGIWALAACCVFSGSAASRSSEYLSLPKPINTSEKSLEQLLEQRRSVRAYREAPLYLADVGQLLWAAQGISDPRGFRTSPSAGALYPLELYVVAGAVDGLPPAVYHYRPKGHRLVKTSDGDRRQALARAALGQSWVRDAAVVVVLAAIFERTSRKYGNRGVRYVHMEVGHAAQNLFLQAEALALATVVVGAFDDEEVSAVLRLPSKVQPLMLMPVGRK